MKYFFLTTFLDSSVYMDLYEIHSKLTFIKNLNEPEA